MAQITFKGEQIHTIGNLPAIGTRAPDFRLTKGDLQDVSLSDFNGKKKILNLVPSLDTGVCAASTVRFNKEISKLPDTVVLTVSADLPFAQSRFCSSNNIDRVITLSQLRTRDFGKNYGIEMTTGPLAGLLARAVVVLDMDNKIVYSQLVDDIGTEPDYEKALTAAKNA
jgi:thiol peroxidase